MYKAWPQAPADETWAEPSLGAGLVGLGSRFLKHEPSRYALSPCFVAVIQLVHSGVVMCHYHNHSLCHLLEASGAQQQRSCTDDVGGGTGVEGMRVDVTAT